MSYGAMIDHVRAALGERPRRFSFWTRRRNRLARPRWMGRGDGLREVLGRQGELYRDGAVVWGIIVQANTRLFQPVGGDLPASVVYACDEFVDAFPEHLEDVAAEVQAVKSAEVGGGSEGIVVEHLKGRDRNPRIALPPEMSRGLEAFLGAVLVRRRHLPGGRVTAPLVPLLVHDAFPQLMIVPWWYWPEGLVEVWRRGA